MILESFAYKKAVIATDFGSLSELVRNHETGLTFEYGDVNDFKSKIDYMFGHPEEARKMGEQSYRYILSEYSPEVHYKQLYDLFESVVKSKKLQFIKKSK